MTAVEFSPQERARLAAIEAAQPAPESWEATVERMARAIWEAENPGYAVIYTADDLTQLWSFNTSGHYHRIAEAAIAALDPS